MLSTVNFMDINRLSYFCAIVRTGSLKEASELLHVTPAALSKAMRILESELQGKLLIPAGRGVAVTDYGKKVANKAETLLTEIQSLRAGSTPTASPHEKTLKLGSFEVFSTHALGAIYETAFRGYSFKLHELTPGKLEEAVALGIIDMGVTYLPIPRPDLDFLKVTAIEMNVFGVAHKFKNLPFNQLPFVVPVTPVTGSPNRVQGLDGWPDHLTPRRIVHEVTLMESALELCRRGIATAYLPTFVARLHNQTVVPAKRLVKIPHPRTNSDKQYVYLVKRKSAHEDETLKKLAKALRIICRDQ